MTIHGPQIINISPGTKNGDVKKIQNYGIPKLPPNQLSKGNHFIHLKIRIPTNLNTTAKNLLREYAKCEPEIEEDEIDPSDVGN
jgi:DnaJ-class molecular chaperone